MTFNYLTEWKNSLFAMNKNCDFFGGKSDTSLKNKKKLKSNLNFLQIKYILKSLRNNARNGRCGKT